MDFGGNIGKTDYAWELSLFKRWKSFEDGISFLEIWIDWGKAVYDHSPAFKVFLAILNFKIIDFAIYYKYHRDKV